MRPLVSSFFAVPGLIACASAIASGPQCTAQSAATLTPVIELYTSEGCSSCPPADRWLSSLKASAASGQAVVQAFHVGYWDYIGWVDRFASPAYTARQRQVAAWNHQSGIYTPQLVRNGQDWRDYSHALASSEPARAQIAVQRSAEDAFEAQVTPAHNSKVKAGENAGEFLQHDFVVRQYVAAGEYRGPSKLTLRAIAGQPGHPRQVNLVVFDPKSGKPLQALSVGC
jgi:hypothetical protein